VVHDRLLSWALTAEGAVHGVVDALVERASAGLLIGPDVEVAQSAVGPPDTQVQQAPLDGLGIDTYAAAVAEMSPRTPPVFEALRIAAASDPTCAALHTEITERRASNMRLLAAELRATGSVRGDLSDADLADIVWVMSSADYYLLLVQRRGWTPQHFGEHLDLDPALPAGGLMTEAQAW
jgi:hypothetical protein